MAVHLCHWQSLAKLSVWFLELFSANFWNFEKPKAFLESMKKTDDIQKKFSIKKKISIFLPKKRPFR
jgi:hypothetical protein